MCKIMEDLAIESRIAGDVKAIVTYIKRTGSSTDNALDFFSIPTELRSAYREMIEAYVGD